MKHQWSPRGGGCIIVSGGFSLRAFNFFLCLSSSLFFVFFPFINPLPNLFLLCITRKKIHNWQKKINNKEKVEILSSQLIGNMCNY